MSGKEIHRLFTVQFASQPLTQRAATLRKHLKQHLTKQFFAHVRELKMDVDKQVLLRFEQQLERILDTYLENWPVFDVFAMYRDLLTRPEMLRKLAPEWVSDEVVTAVSQSSKELFDEQRMEAEDVAPLLYLTFLLHGVEEPMFDHAVVDEAQDLSALEILLITMMTKRNSVTIVGDLAQAIHAYRGLENWNELLDGVFKGSASFYTLRQSYRSTVEIMRFANRILNRVKLPNITPAVPVLRHGAEPQVVPVETQHKMYQEILSRIRSCQQEGYKSIAVVTKTAERSRRAAKALGSYLPEAALISAKDVEFPGGVTFMPAYLTKGLQFDVVILLDVDEEPYPLEGETAKLLYVATTRPVHRLIIFHIKGKASPLLTATSTD